MQGQQEFYSVNLLAGAGPVASVNNEGEHRWVVHLGNPNDSCVTVEVNMNLEAAKKIAERETQRIAKLNPGRDDLDPQNAGSAVMSVLGLFASGAEF